MPTDLKSDAPDAIAYRDLPSMRPNDPELRVIADRIIERTGVLSVHDARWLRIELMMTLIEVRRIATDHACNKAREYYQMRKSW
jgi:hypothetical protein